MRKDNDTNYLIIFHYLSVHLLSSFTYVYDKSIHNDCQDIHKPFSFVHTKGEVNV